MGAAIIRKAIQDKQQNETTKTNLNYIQNFVHFKKQNLIKKSK